MKNLQRIREKIERNLDIIDNEIDSGQNISNNSIQRYKKVLQILLKLNHRNQSENEVIEEFFDRNGFLIFQYIQFLPFDKAIVDLISSYGYLYFDDIILAGYNDIRYLHYVNSFSEPPVQISDFYSGFLWSLASEYLDDSLYSDPEYQYQTLRLIFKIQDFNLGLENIEVSKYRSIK